MDDDSALYDDLNEHGDNGHSATTTLDKPANGSAAATTSSERRPSLSNTDDTDDNHTESGRTRSSATPLTASSASSAASRSGSSTVSVNNPNNIDDSNLHFLRFRALYSASPADLLALLEPQRPTTLYTYLSSQGRRTGDHFASFDVKEDRDAVLSRELTPPFTTGGKVHVHSSSKREQLAADRRSKGTDRRTREDSVALKLKGIPFAIREDGIEQWLLEHDVKVVDVHIAEDWQSGRVAGDALIEVEDEESAATAEKLTKSMLQNRYVDVIRLTSQMFEDELHPSPPSQAQQHSGPLRRPPPPTDTRSRSYGDDAPSDYGAVPPSSGPLVHQLPRLAPQSTDCLFMQGLPIGCQQSDVVNFFGELSIVPLRIHRKERGPDAFIEFRSIEEAERAMQLKRRHMGSRWIDLIRVTYTDMCKITGLPPTRDNVAGGGRLRDDRDSRRRGSRERDEAGRGSYDDRRDRERQYDRRDDRHSSGSGGSAAGDRYRTRSRSPVSRRRDEDYGSRGGGSDRNGGRDYGRDSYRDGRGGGGSSYRDSDRGSDRHDRDRDERDDYRRR